MKLFKKISIRILVIVFLISLSSCANAKLRPHAGVDVTWGSHGPQVRPHMGVEVYNGGRH